MQKKTVGFSLMLLSLILMVGFDIDGRHYIGDTDIAWVYVWMLTAIVGFVLTVWTPEEK